MDARTPIVARAIEAIRGGDVDGLRRLLDQEPGLSTARVTETRRPGEARTLLHVATDWPGHFPNGPETVALLASRGADVDAPFVGAHAETPLHWAASSGDVAVLDALLDLGADIDTPGGVIAGGTPLADAVTFAQWSAARRLVERGARVGLREAAALGLLDRVRTLCEEGPTREEIDRAFWMACHGGRRDVAEYLLRTTAADLNRLPPWERVTALDAASRNGFEDVATWLRGQGGKSASELD